MHTIRGEYWIIDGSVNYADGDVGDTNHEGYALDHLRRKILGAVGVDAGDMYDWDDAVQDIPIAVGDTLDAVFLGGGLEHSADDVAELLAKYAKELALDPEDIDQAFGRAAQDVRDYMAQKHGWICCHRDRFATWYLTKDAISVIAGAVGDILDEEGFFNEGDDESRDVELEIFVVSTNKTYSASWRALEKGDFSELPFKEEEPEIGPNAQVKAMDREIEHPYYQSKTL